MKLNHLTASLILGITSIYSAQAVVLFDDADGVFASSNGAAPTALAFAPGSNEILGSVSTGGLNISNTRNFYTFTIGAGQTLDAIILSAIDVTTSTGGPSSDPGFLALVNGTTSVNPGTGFSNLGGSLYSPVNLNTDFLPILATGGNSGGTGFTAPLGPGDYTFVIQQTGNEVSNFTLDFQVSAIPEPSTTGTLLLGSLLLIRRRKRK